MTSEAGPFFLGLDLGDGDSCLAFCRAGSEGDPSVFGGGAMPTAICEHEDVSGERRVVIGLDALMDPEGVRLNVSFKSDPAGDPGRWRLDGAWLSTFAVTLYERFAAEHPDAARDCRIVIGCPSGWTDDARGAYQALFADVFSHPVEVLPESASALIQTWELEDLPWDLLSERVVLIDIGASTTDISVIEGGSAHDYPGGSELGLSEIDELLLGRLREVHHDPQWLDGVLRESLSRRAFVLYMCRLRKEVTFGAQRGVGTLLETWPWSRPIWESLQRIDVPAVFSGRGTDGRASWLERFGELLADAADSSLAGWPRLVILTGGGSHVPQLRDAARAAFPGVEPLVSGQPSLGVGMGLAGYGRWKHHVREFRDRALALADDEGFKRELLPAYPHLLAQALRCLGETATDGIWEPMAELWQRDELKLKERGEFMSFAHSLYREWLRGPGRGSFDAPLAEFSDTVDAALAQPVACLAREFAIPVSEFKVSVTLTPIDFFEDVVGGAAWAAQAAIFRAVDSSPPMLRRALGGEFLKACLAADKLLRKAAFGVVDALGDGSEEITEDQCEMLDRYVRAAVHHEVDRQLGKIERLLLRPRG